MEHVLVAAVVSLIIIIHELGHLLAAKAVGVPVARFSVGFGPRLVRWVRGHTEYWVSLIPFGGYVMPDVEDEDDLFRIPVGKRVAFAMGGPLANILLVFVMLATIVLVKEGPSLAALTSKPLGQVWAMLVGILQAVGSLFDRPDQLSGVIGIIAQGGRMIGSDFTGLLGLTASLSMNLAVLNLLPLPILDGGQMLLTLMEKIIPKVTRVRVPLALVSWVVMIGLLIYATYLDIGRIA